MERMVEQLKEGKVEGNNNRAWLEFKVSIFDYSGISSFL